MFENIKNIFKRSKKRELLKSSSKDTAKERLHLVLMQDRANVSADFLDLMRQEIVEVIKKYIDIDEDAMDVRLATETNEDGTQGAPALYANIPIINIKDETRQMSKTNQESHIKPNDIKEEIKTEDKEQKQEDLKEEKNSAKETKVNKEVSKENTEENKIEEKKNIEEEKQEDNKNKAKKPEEKEKKAEAEKEEKVKKASKAKAEKQEIKEEKKDEK